MHDGIVTLFETPFGTQEIGDMKDMKLEMKKFNA
jgi:hypothetical protein